MVNFISITVPEEQTGRRLDRYLKFLFPTLKQGDIEKLIRAKMIKLNAQKTTANNRINNGDILQYPDFLLSQNTPNTRKNSNNNDIISNLKFPTETILYEDNDLMVINKPHGLAVQGGSKLVMHLDKLLDLLPKVRGYRPSLVHRLDKDTSGCLLIAKKPSIAASLGNALKEHQFKKYYIAIVHALYPENTGIIENYVAKSTKGKKDIMQIVDSNTPESQYAISAYHILSKLGDDNFYAVLLSPFTGRTHQLRVHCQSLNIPILGDGKYNTHTNNKFNKLCLHAQRLVFTHPKTNEEIIMNAPLPAHIKKIFDTHKTPLQEILKYDDYAIIDHLKNQWKKLHVLFLKRC